jgi:hypothetical protein
MKVPPLVIVAHSVAPGPGGAEAEVNAHLLQALATRWPAPVIVITGGRSVAVDTSRRASPIPWTVDALGECGENGGSPPLASRAAAVCLARIRSGGPRAILPRVANRLTYWATGQGVKYAWRLGAARAIERALILHPGAVVYSRALPFSSIAAAARVRRRRSFPWIVNINDPLPPGLWPGLYAVDERTDRRIDAGLQRLIPLVSAFTFSAAELRALEVARYPAIANVPSLILPHAPTPTAAGTAPIAVGETRTLRIAFLGTLRGNRVRAEFFEGVRLALAADPALAQQLRLSFLVPVLNERLAVVCRSLDPIVDVQIGLSNGDLQNVARNADVLLDLESEHDAPLLLAKLAQYVGHRKPVWAICVEGGATWQLATQHDWGYTTALGDAAGVARTLATILDDWQRGALAGRTPAADLIARFSPNRIVSDLQDLCVKVAADWAAASS